MKNDFETIWINGMPRSGTSWVGQIFDSSPEVNYKLAPLFSYAFKDYLDENSTPHQVSEFFDKVYSSEDEFLTQKERRKSGIYPQFAQKIERSKFLVIKDTRYHNLIPGILEKNNSLRIIHIIRHPCGAINSWLKASKEFPQHLDKYEFWRNGACRKTGKEEFWGFDDWVNISNKYLKLSLKYPDRISLVQYDKLVEDPVTCVKDFFNFCGITWTDQTSDFLTSSHELHNKDDYSVFKNRKVKDAWKDELDDFFKETIFSELKGTDLEKFL